MEHNETRAGVTCDRDGAIALVKLDRESKRNSLDMATIESLDSTLLELRDDTRVRVVILTGAGNEVFSVGADVSAISALEPDEALSFVRKGLDVAALIEMLGKPVIGAINGVAIGLGCELTLACHIRIATSAARFSASELGVGVNPVFGFSRRLACLLGKSRALELALTGGELIAAEAAHLGLVNRIVGSDRLIEEATAVAREIALGSPLAMKSALEAINRGSVLSVADALEFEGELFSECFATEDMREGVRAFLEKRPPDFKGR